MDEEKKFIKRAIELARESVAQGGFPAGALLVKDGKIISEATSTGYKQYDPSGHADITSIREACKSLKTANLEGSIMYGSLECCNMCFSAANWAGVSKIVFACKKTPDMVTKNYYEGATDNHLLNDANLRKIEVVHASFFDAESLKVIKEWEAAGGFNSTSVIVKQ